MEALGLGRPVVLADTSGLTELGRQGLATLVPADAGGDHVATALLDAASSRRWADAPPALPSWDDCAAALLDVYRAIARR
jgi:glycosyltransferase involved in cell wall biosynthesis